MSYPFFSKAEARIYLSSSTDTDDGSPVPLPEMHMSPDGEEVDWEAIADDARTAMENLMSSLKDSGKKAGSEFETSAVPLLHSALPEHQALADPQFWIWFAVSHGRDIIRWRYGDDVTNLKNFGIGGAGENLFYRIWLRGEIAFTAADEDPYRLARSGDIDFWRSHIFRQSYGDARDFARALLEFQFPASRAGKARLSIREVRSLAKHLKRARSNLIFEVMSESHAYRFIESEWERIAPENA